MSDEKVVDQAQETEDGDGGEATHSRLDALAEKVDQLFEMVRKRPAAARSTRADDAADVGSQVRAEVGKLREAEEKRKNSDALAGRIDAMEQAIKKIAEKAPVEYSKVTNWMWGSDE